MPEPYLYEVDELDYWAMVLLTKRSISSSLALTSNFQSFERVGRKKLSDFPHQLKSMNRTSYMIFYVKLTFSSWPFHTHLKQRV